MKVAQILRNALYLFASNVFVRAISAVTTIFVARYLGVKEYGMLGVGLAFSGVLSYLTDLGSSQTIIRESTRPNARLAELFSSLVKVRVILVLISIIISVACIEILYPERTLKSVVYWVTIPTIVGSALDGIGTAYFQATQRMKTTAVARSVAGMATVAALIVCLLSNYSVIYISTIYGLSSIISGLISVFAASRQISFVRGWNSSIISNIWAFTLGGFVVMILPQLGPIILQRVTDLTQVGYFSAAYRIPGLLYQIPGILAAAFYPMLFEHGNRQDLESHLELNITELKLMSASGMLMALPFIIHSQWIMHILFGQAWSGVAASHTLMILASVVILQSINYPLADSLTTKGMQSKRTKVLIGDLVLSIVAYIVLGHVWGSEGGGVAVLLTESILMCGLVFVNPSGKILLYKGIKSNIIAFLISGATGYGLLFVPNQYVGICCTIVIFPATLVVLDPQIRSLAAKYITKIQLNSKVN